MADMGRYAAYDLVAKTRTDVLPITPLPLELVKSKTMVVAAGYPNDKTWWPEHRNMGNFSAFGTPEDMKIYFDTFRMGKLSCNERLQSRDGSIILFRMGND